MPESGSDFSKYTESRKLEEEKAAKRLSEINEKEGRSTIKGFFNKDKKPLSAKDVLQMDATDEDVARQEKKDKEDEEKTRSEREKRAREARAENSRYRSDTIAARQAHRINKEERVSMFDEGALTGKDILHEEALEDNKIEERRRRQRQQNVAARADVERIAQVRSEINDIPGVGEEGKGEIKE